MPLLVTRGIMKKRLSMAGFAVYKYIAGLMIFESWRDRVSKQAIQGICLRGYSAPNRNTNSLAGQ
jgi:hypothetical protein